MKQLILILSLLPVLCFSQTITFNKVETCWFNSRGVATRTTGVSDDNSTIYFGEDMIIVKTTKMEATYNITSVDISSYSVKNDVGTEFLFVLSTGLLKITGEDIYGDSFLTTYVIETN